MATVFSHFSSSDPYICSECRLMLTTRGGLRSLASADELPTLYDALGEFIGQHWLNPVEQQLRVFADLQYAPVRNSNLFAIDSRHQFDAGTLCGVDGVITSRHPFHARTLSGIYGVIKDRRNLERKGRVLRAFTDQTDPAATYIEHRPLLIEVASDSVTLKIKERLQSCQGVLSPSHSACQEYYLPLLPTRVIDVIGGKDSEHVRLHASRPNERSQYLTLSYCWGGAQVVTLTQATLESKLHTIPLDNLPKTINDAIRITRRIGFRFLWVDALCIIQDSEQDLAHEVPNMGVIYHNATLNIAASAAGAVTDGFLENRPAPDAYSASFYTGPNKFGNVSFLPYTKYVPQRILDSRAWAFQESIFAQRQLIFGDKEVLWRCRTDYLKPLSQSHIIYKNDYALKQWPFRSVWSSPMDDNWGLGENRFQAWKGLIEEYTKRKLTFNKDRLLAIAGIISKLQSVFEDRCLFGLWEKDFIRELAWRGTGNGVRERLSYIAPNWSWASLTGEIIFERLETIVAEIIQVPPSRAPERFKLGRRTEDMIILRAPLLKPYWRQESGCDSFDFPVDSTINSEDLIYMVLGYSRVRIIGLILNLVIELKYKRVGYFSRNFLTAGTYGKDLPITEIIQLSII